METYCFSEYLRDNDIESLSKVRENYLSRGYDDDFIEELEAEYDEYYNDYIDYCNNYNLNSYDDTC